MARRYLRENFTFFSSFLYRVFILAFGLYIFCTQDSCFPSYVYITVSVVYLLLILFVFYTFLKNYPIARTLLDLSYITFILYNKSITDNFRIENALFILLPYLNSRNHTQKGRNSILVGFFICISFLFLNISVNASILFFILVFILGFIDFLNGLGKKIDSDLDRVIIDGITSAKKSSIHKILEQFVLAINDTALIGNNLAIKTISIVKIVENQIIVLASDKFVFQIDCKKQMLAELFSKKIIHTDQITIQSDKTYTNSFIVPLNNLFFILSTDKEFKIRSTLARWILEDLSPLFRRIATLVNSDALQKNNKRSFYKTNISRLTYINNALNIMHFVRNKLGPIKNLIAASTVLPAKMVENNEAFMNLFQIEANRSKNSLNELTTRASRLLDNNKNPFSFNNKAKIKLKGVISLINSLWQEHLVLQEQIVYQQIDKFNIDNNLCIFQDENALFIAFTDLFENVRKYSNEHSRLHYSLDDKILTLRVYSNPSLNAKMTKDIVRKYVNDFNSVNVYEFTQRTTRGIYLIKTLFAMLNFEHSIGYNNSTNEMVTTIKILFQDDNQHSV